MKYVVDLIVFDFFVDLMVVICEMGVFLVFDVVGGG